MLVQEYLKTHSLNELKEAHGVNHRIHDHKFSLNYDMLEARDSDPIACECRGVVLMPVSAKEILPDEVIGDTIVLCRTMDRFFNHGQESAANVDFTAKDVRFYEKYDGTMTAVYHDSHKDEWCVSTRSIPEANLPIDGFGDYTFRTLFEKALYEHVGHKFDDWTDKFLSEGMTYIFELCTPVNRIVVDYADYFLVLLAARCRTTGNEFDIKQLNIDVAHCKTFELSSLKDMIEFVSDRDPSQHEGLVVCDSDFNRVKVKNPGYLALGRIKESATRSPRALLEICLLNKLDDAWPLLPEHVKEKALQIKEGLRAFIKDSEQSYESVLREAKLHCADPSNERDFRKHVALAVNNQNAWMGYIMLRFNGKVSSFQEFVETNKNPDTGEYKRSFLEHVLKECEKRT